MVIKTDFCAFTEMKIYPGTGSKFVGKDGKLHSFLSHKVICLFHMKVKPMKKRWTQAWRRMNKKGRAEEIHRKKTRRTQKVQKAIVGLSLEEIRKRRTEKPKSDAQSAALKEAKDKKKTPIVKIMKGPKGQVADKKTTQGKSGGGKTQTKTFAVKK
eukprot:Platyproteum_vivax@DN6997_c0_g1_i2.p2